MLARRADASIFGAGEPTEEEVREYWTIVDGSLKEMTSSIGFWRRQQARFSPRSLLADARTAMNSGKGLTLRGGRVALPALGGILAARRRRVAGGTAAGDRAGTPNAPSAPRPETPGRDMNEPNQQGPNQQ
jgi:hypothetical protein